MTLTLTAFGITTLSKTVYFMAENVMVLYFLYCHAECTNAECLYAECLYAECRFC